jgi:glutamate formiminotransferase
MKIILCNPSFFITELEREVAAIKTTMTSHLEIELLKVNVTAKPSHTLQGIVGNPQKMLTIET